MNKFLWSSLLVLALGSCSTNGERIYSDSMPSNISDLIYDGALSLANVEKIYIKLEGEVYLNGYLSHFKDPRVKRDVEEKMDPETYGLEYSESFVITNIATIYQIFP